MKRFTRALATLLIAACPALPSYAAAQDPAAPDPAAPDPTGLWTTGKNQAVTQVYECGGDQLCGELVGFPMDHASDPMPETWNHQPQCHFVFIRYLRDQGDFWKGTIINPKSGSSYGAEVSLVSPNQLRLRGYVLFQALGATRFWARYNGPPPPADCRMAANSLN